jgi:hypothetical protein
MVGHLYGGQQAIERLPGGYDHLKNLQAEVLISAIVVCLDRLV